MANVELKQPMVQEIAGCVDGAQAVVVVDYRGLNVAQDTELRKQMRDAGITYKVYKNTLMKRAFEGTDFAQLDPVLEGPSAIAVSKDDATAPARLIAKFAKQVEALEFKAGVVEGGFYDAEGMAVIATIPTREELLGRLFGSMQSPIASFARVINQIAENGGAQVEAAADEAPAEAESNLASSSEEEAKPEVVEEPTAVEAESESPESADA